MNYISQFTAEEIHEAKKCLLNGMRNPVGYAGSPFASPEKKRGRQGGFALSVHATDEAHKEQQHEEEKKDLVEPKTRAPGGVWVQASDIPHSFQNFIVYHNVSKMTHVQNFADKWMDASQPYIVNEKDVIVKLELDEEALKQHMTEYQNQVQAHNELEGKFLPGKHALEKPAFDQVLIAFAPHPTNKPHQVLPRYLMNLSQFDLDGSHSDEGMNPSHKSSANLPGSYAETNNPLHKFDQHTPVDITFKSYFEGKLLNFTGDSPQQRPIIWLKPNLVAPQGYHLWVAGLCRKVQVVTKADYLNQVHGILTTSRTTSSHANVQTTVKNYQVDMPLLEKGKYHLFGKYDFQVAEADTAMHLKVDIPNDKYLLKYMRMRLIDKGATSKKYGTQTEGQRIFNVTKFENLVLQPNAGKGYSIVIEGVPPYNTAAEGNQLQIELISNRPDLNLEEVQQVEPFEYGDKYAPSKYGIIFKEKLFVGPDNTSAAFNIRLRKGGQDLEDKRLFRIDIYDQGRIIYT